ncbi:MAG: LacI family DNA-binding transcriptional regulator [Paraburkholderia sp.]|jgi:LacI family transcriptional regulator|uniref:LacI family DNA-binding transcriptional regulator n=1 Tax=Paraburkholderia sp. TaxID=1926495 RepID=UPI00397D39D0
MVSLKQVAALAGVSSSTVSRAIIAPERLHPKTLKKVQEAIASLDYVPFAPARVLRSGRSRTIGIVSDFNERVVCASCRYLGAGIFAV